MDTRLPLYSQIQSSESQTKIKLPVLIKRYAVDWMKLILILSDLFSLYIGGAIAYQLRSAMGGFYHSDLYIPFLLVPFLFVTVFASRGLYRPVGMGAVEEFRRLLITNSLVFLILSSITFLVKTPPVFSRLMFGFAWLLTSISLPIIRLLARILFSSLHLWGAPAVVIFSSKVPVAPKEMEVVFNEQMVRGIIPVQFSREIDENIQEKLIINQSNNRIKFCLIFFGELNEIEHLRRHYKTIFERIIFIRYQSDGLDFSNLHISHLGGTVGLEFHQRLLSESARLQKRVLDLILSIILLIFLSPIFLLITIAIKLDSIGGAYYTQPRIGKKGKFFKMVKFRTMQKDADDCLDTYLSTNPAAKNEWDCYQKLEKDPRVTRVGHFLRKTSLDELPQLFNVLMGQMSLVGPRPFMTNQQEAYGKAFEFYISVPPGMTGLWQVSGRNKTTFARRALLDERYVKSWSVWLDIYILARTVWVLITRDGAS